MAKDHSDTLRQIWTGLDDHISERRGALEAEKQDREGFLAEFRKIANRTIEPVCRQAEETAKSDGFSVSCRYDKTHTVTLTVSIPTDEVASVYPGSTSYKRQDHGLTFRADAARRFVVVDSVIAGEEESRDLELGAIDEETIIREIGAFITAVQGS